MSILFNGMANSFRGESNHSLEKNCVKMLLSLAQSDRERKCMKYTVLKASGISATKARQMYGLEDMSKHVNRVEQAIHEVQEIRQTLI